MALFMNTKVAAQLLILLSLSAIPWQRKPWLVNSTANSSIPLVLSQKTVASKLWHLTMKMLFLFCAIRLLISLPKLLVVSSQTFTWVSVQLFRTDFTMIQTIPQDKFPTKIFLVSKKKWRRLSRRISRQFAKKWQKIKREKFSRMILTSWNWLRSIQKMKVVWQSTVKVNMWISVVDLMSRQLDVFKFSIC